jgi:hypothetical protein
MMKLTLVFVALFAFAGCKKKGGNDTAAAMAKMTEFKDEMCKCKDAACASSVSDKMMKWSAEQNKDKKEPPKMSEADTKKRPRSPTKWASACRRRWHRRLALPRHRPARSCGRRGRSCPRSAPTTGAGREAQDV